MANDASTRATTGGRNNSGAGSNSPTVSVIMPVFNEENDISDNLLSVRMSCKPGTEIVVVDGGSTDATVAIARPLCDRLFHSSKGRAIQMNTGAQYASGSILWFLHSDSHVPEHADTLICDSLANGRHNWGRFDIQLSGSHPMLRVVERLMNVRSRVTGICTGDQGLFVSRELFSTLGGFPEVALMEDIAMSQKLKLSGQPLCLSQRLVTSSRRWEHYGILKTILLMWKLRLLYFAGVAPDTLARMYYGRGN